MGYGTVSFVFSPVFRLLLALRLFSGDPDLWAPWDVSAAGRDMGDWEASKRSSGWWRECVFRLAVIVAIGLGADPLVSFLIFLVWFRHSDCAAWGSCRWFIPHHSPPRLKPTWSRLTGIVTWGSLPLRLAELHVIGVGWPILVLAFGPVLPRLILCCDR